MVPYACDHSRDVTMSSALYGGRDPADVPAYRLPEAASMVGLPTSTLRSWVRGRSFPIRDGQGRSEPIIIAPDARALSFTNVVEAHVLAAMRRRYDLDLDTIRRAVRWVTDVMRVDHPLARVQFKTDKLNLFVEHLGDVISASDGGQLGMRKVLDLYLERIEYGKDDRAVRLFPLYRANAPRVVVIDPRVAFGRPVIAGTAAPIADIADRRDAGESVADLALDYDVTPEEIEEALSAAVA